MTDRYILEGKKAVPCEDLEKWARGFESSDRQVKRTMFKRGVDVSTVFLGLDHSFVEGPPMLFETMVFVGGEDRYCERYTTWEQAEAGHDLVVAKVKARELV